MIRQAALVAGIAMAGILLTAELVKGSVGLAQLPNLAPAPAGFELRLYTDGNGYVVS